MTRAFPELMQAIVDQSPIAVLITDVEGEIVYVNACFSELSGYSSTEIVGKRPSVLTSGEQPQEYYKQMWEVILRGETWRGTFSNVRQDGSKFSVQSWIVPMRCPETDEITHFVGMQQDMSETRSLEEQVRRAQRLESLGVMAGGIAHEFNNLLTPIFGYVDLVRASEPSLQAHRYLDHIERAAERARRLVNQILAFSRDVSHGKSLIDVGVLVKETLKLTRASFPTTVEIETEVSGAKHSVLADPALLRQLLMNFYANAYDAMQAKGGKLSVSVEQVELDAEAATLIEPDMPAGSYEAVRVSDEGVGIGKELLHRVFDPFFTTKLQAGGTGLGLSEARGIAVESGGGIGVESEVGVGSTFTLYLPCAVDKAEPPTPEEAPRGTERILFVDDEAPVAELGKDLLESYGYTVITKTNSVEALLAINDGLQVDLLVTDQVMPHLTGLQLAREVHTRCPQLPVLLITGFSEQIDARNFAELGLRGFLNKPFRPRELALTIRRILDRSSED